MWDKKNLQIPFIFSRYIYVHTLKGSVVINHAKISSFTGQILDAMYYSNNKNLSISFLSPRVLYILTFCTHLLIINLTRNLLQ